MPPAVASEEDIDVWVRPSETRPNQKDLDHTKLLRLTAPHVESFDYFLGEGLVEAVSLLDPVELLDQKDNRATFRIESVDIGNPINAQGKQLTPRECREFGLTYSVPLFANVSFCVEGAETKTEQVNLGHMPIMVKSARCALRGLGPKELMAKGEEAYELGGYFIVNGNERMIRMLITPRKNHIMALIRPAFTKRGPTYTKFGCQIRCGRRDQSSQSVVLHYLSTGDCNLRITLRKQEYFLPVTNIHTAICHCGLTSG